MFQSQRPNSSRPRRSFQSGGFRGGQRRAQGGTSRHRRSFGSRDDRGESRGDFERNDRFDRPRSGGFNDRPRRDFGDRRTPRFRDAEGGSRGDRPEFSGDRPYQSRGANGSFGGRDRGDRPFSARPRSGGFGSRGPRRDFGRSGGRSFDDRPRSGGFNDRPRRDFGDRPSGAGFRDRRDDDREQVERFSDYREKSYTRDFERDTHAEQKNDTSWEGVSDWYDAMLEADADSYQAQVVAPNITRLMHIQFGDRIVDLGCGQGFFSRIFAEAGAKVTGVDASPDLIAKAKEKAHPESRFIVAPASETGLQEGSADSVAIILALQNMEDMHAVLKEASRLLTPRGKLYIVLNHPAFRIPQHSDWTFDENKNTQSRSVSQYMSDAKIKIDMTPGQKEMKKFTWSFHHPLQSYMKHLYNTGFVTCRMEEWASHKQSQPGPRAEAENVARREIPLFLCIEARKQSNG